MSRRITFFVLATSATLIATQASADRECFEDSCRLKDAAETAQAAPAMDESAAPEASAAVQAPVPVKALPQVVETPEVVALPQVAAAQPPAPPVVAYPQPLTPRIVPLRVAADPVRQPPPPPAQNFADEAPLPRERTTRPAPRYAKAPAAAPVRVAQKSPPVVIADEVPETMVSAQPVSRPRPMRVSSTEPAYIQGYNQVPNTGVVVVVPAGTATTRYMFAPNAKIISIDSDD